MVKSICRLTNMEAPHLLRHKACVWSTDGHADKQSYNMHMIIIIISNKAVVRQP